MSNNDISCFVICFDKSVKTEKVKFSDYLLLTKF